MCSIPTAVLLPIPTSLHQCPQFSSSLNPHGTHFLLSLLASWITVLLLIGSHAHPFTFSFSSLSSRVTTALPIVLVAPSLTSSPHPQWEVFLLKISSHALCLYIVLGHCYIHERDLSVSSPLPLIHFTQHGALGLYSSKLHD